MLHKYFYRALFLLIGVTTDAKNMTGDDNSSYCMAAELVGLKSVACAYTRAHINTEPHTFRAWFFKHIPYSLITSRRVMQELKENPFAAEQDSYELQNNSHLDFFDEVDSVKRELVQYEDNIERIEGLQRRSLAESREAEMESLQRQIDQIRSSSRGLAEELKTRIKYLESQSFHDATRYAQSANLKRQFMSLIQKFQATEAAFRKRYRDVAARQYRIVDPYASEEQVQQYLDEDQLNGSGNQIFSQALQSNRRGEARAALSEVQMRHREIQKIESTMTELAQLFHDMEMMVAEQDQQVQQVETNVYTAQQDIERGVDNQQVALKKAKAWRRKKWCCAITLLVVIIVLALVLGIYFGVRN